MTSSDPCRDRIDTRSCRPCAHGARARALRRLPALMALGLLPCGHGALAQSAQGAGSHAHHHHAVQQSEPDADPDGVDIVVPDAELVTQHGAEVRLATDIVGDKLVVMDFVYTTCTTVCPVLSAIFSQVQARLADRIGRDVALVSISVDPVRDTPARMKAYSAKHGARDGWVWLTGTKPGVDHVLRELGAYTPNFEDHPSMVLIGDGRTGEWVRLLGFPGVDQIVSKVDELSAARAAAGSTARLQEDR